MQERNIELAALLDKRSRAHERVLARFNSVKEQSVRTTAQFETDRAALEASAKRDMGKAQEQVSE